MKFYIETFGCKVNSYESEYISESLISNGFFLSNMNDADIIIVNTCTVTNTADSKCKKYVRRIRRENPDAILAVVGCSSQNNFSEYKEMGIDILLGNKEKSNLYNIIINYINTKEKYYSYDNNRDLPFEDMRIKKFEHTRAFIKVQDGCDNFCSYCVIPFVRGKCRSKDFNEVIEESIDLVNSGHKEIVLTGIHTGSYSYDGKDLVDLINEMSKIEGLERIRLSSVEATELNDKFMDMLKNNTKFCNHMHIPIQSGSNAILKRMNRKYDLEYFENKIKEIRNIRSDISITTDLIIGFPEETEEEFIETYETIKRIKFSKVHVFPFSKRDGTKAAMLKEIKDSEKTNRVHKMLELSDMLEKEYSDMFKGKMIDVLIEEVNDNGSVGHTSNYLKVITDKKLNRGEIYSILYK